MGIGTTDIVARLQLRAEQFSSEAGQRFAELKTNARSAASTVRSEFNTAFSEVQKIAATSLQMPRTATGSLDLSREISQLNASATAAEMNAIAQRELGAAFRAASAAAGVDAQALLANADAAMIAERASEQEAAALRAKISAYNAVQNELNQTTSATRQLTAAEERQIATAVRTRGSFAQVGAQLTDFTVQVQSGQSAAIAFIQQFAQMGFALQAAGGKLEGVGKFLLGPWGTALTIGLAVLSPFVAKLFEAGNALDEQIDKLRKDAAEAAIADKAHTAFTQTLDGQTAAQRKLNEEMERGLKSQRQLTEQKLRDSEQNLFNRENDAEVARRQLEPARRRLAEVIQEKPTETKNAAAAGAYASKVAEAQKQVADLERRIADAESAIQSARVGINLARIGVAKGDAADMAEPIKAIGRQYDDLRDRETENARIAAQRGKEVDQAALTRRLANIETERQAALKTQREKEEAARRSDTKARREAERTMILGAPVDGPVSSGFGQRAAPRLTNGGLGSANHPAIDYAVPTGTSVKAGADGIVVYSGTLSGYGKVTIVDYGNGTFGQFNHLSETLKKPGDSVAKGDVVARSGATGNVTGPHLDYRVRTGARFEDGRLQGGQFVDPRSRVKVGSAGDAEANAEDRRNKALAEQAQIAGRVREQIERLNANWDEQPRLIDRARLDTAKLNEQIAFLEEFHPEGWEEMREQAEKTKRLIIEGIDRPFREYVKSQREGLALQSLTLQGRDAEAQAMQDALRIQRDQGRISDEQLATVFRIAQQQERISRAMEDQRRIVSIYTRQVGDLQNSFEQFLTDFDIGKAAGGIIDSVKQVQRSLLSNSIFGGVERQVEDYVRKMTGQKTPAEILADQAGDAGRTLRSHIDDSGDALADFVKAVRGATTDLRGAPGAALGQAGGTKLDLLESKIASALKGGAANDNDGVGEILVTGKIEEAGEKFGLSVVRASSVWEVGVDAMLGNLGRMGVHLPQTITDALKKGLPTVLEGVSLGQMGGSAFASITGGKENKLGSSVGGVLGDIAGKELGKLIPQAATGLLKTLGGAAGPIGAIIGGIAGNLIGGLFNKPKWSDASVTLGANGQAMGTTGSGSGGQAIAAASGTASSVANGINSIADQLGAKISSLPAMTLGTWDGRYRVADVATTKALHSKNFGSNVLHDFGDDQQAAIEYAVRYSISNAVMTGISQASQNILKSGQDLEQAISKALMIEAVPRDLKAMLDPVGAAIDDLNRKFQRTVDALKEGGATAAQMAQAEQLYNLQLEQVKNSTASASQSLKDFLKTLNMGSSSPLSLRSQEATAMAELAPFLEKINAGQTVDQDKYRDAAQAYLDIERQLYGSTQDFFAAFDAVQAATNKAIAAIDNVVPVSPDVESPFAKATAKSTEATAAATSAAAEMLEEVRDLLANLPADLAAQLTASNDGGFIGDGRSFKTGT